VIVPSRITADKIDAMFCDAWRAGPKDIAVFGRDESLDAALVNDTSDRSACGAVLPPASARLASFPLLHADRRFDAYQLKADTQG